MGFVAAKKQGEVSMSGPRPRRLCGWLAAVVALFWVSGCAEPRAQPTPGRPRLIVLVVVDQMRADYLERFRPLWRHGMARLLEEGVVFTEARHDHAVTTTAPGHATLSTGLTPHHHGIVNNSFWDETERDRVAAVDDEKYDLSPRRLLGSTLGGWMKGADRRSKVFTASVKDRGAIFLGGREADGAYWFDAEEGGFLSSSYYPEGRADWLEAFNDRGLPAAELTRLWTAPELPAGAPSLADLGIEELDRGVFPHRFPHLAGGVIFAPTEEFYDDLSDTPFGDRLLVDFALTLVDAEDLGADSSPDLLGLSFSALDIVGHAYGPNSPEIVSALLTFDEALGRLLDALEAKVGRENLLVTLSADHGVVPLPEYQQGHGLPGRRVDVEDLLCLRRAAEALEGELGTKVLNPYGSFEPAARDRVLEEVLEAAVRRRLESCPGVVRVWTEGELGSGRADADLFGRLYARSWHPRRGPDVFIQYEEGFLATRGESTSHGVPYDYDRRVPWILRAPGLRPARRGEAASTVDVAPTVAGLVGIAVPPDRDGVDRSRALRPDGAPSTDGAP